LDQFVKSFSSSGGCVEREHEVVGVVRFHKIVFTLVRNHIHYVVFANNTSDFGMLLILFRLFFRFTGLVVNELITHGFWVRVVQIIFNEIVFEGLGLISRV
jgi:hypothetical protein